MVKIKKSTFLAIQKMDKIKLYLNALNTDERREGGERREMGGKEGEGRKGGRKHLVY